MQFLKSYRGAALITALVILLSVVFGAHRSLTAVRSDVLQVFEMGAYGDGHSVKGDLNARRAVCANLYTVAQRYLPEAELDELGRSLEETDQEAPSASAYENLDSAAHLVIEELEAVSLSEQDAKYVSGFQAELTSRTLTIAKDPYHQRALEFNNDTLGAFPANLLKHVAFVEALPIYR